MRLPSRRSTATRSGTPTSRTAPRRSGRASPTPSPTAALRRPASPRSSRRAAPRWTSLYNPASASLGFRQSKSVIQGGVAMVRVLVPRRRVLAVMGGALSAPYVASGVARAADDWPNKPVRYINLFPAGGATDVLSRVVCQQLSELTGQQFVVDNKGGSGGNVGADAIAHSTPDGYTVGLMSIASHAISPTLYSKLPFDAEKDFTPISMLWQVPNIFVVRPDVPAKTVPELVALVKASPGKYTFASGGSGTSPHIC